MSRDDEQRLADIDEAVRAIQVYAREGAGMGPSATRLATRFCSGSSSSVRRSRDSHQSCATVTMTTCSSASLVFGTW